MHELTATELAELEAFIGEPTWPELEGMRLQAEAELADWLEEQDPEVAYADTLGIDEYDLGWEAREMDCYERYVGGEW
jgi:hypothetical protein